MFTHLCCDYDDNAIHDLHFMNDQTGHVLKEDPHAWLDSCETPIYELPDHGWDIEGYIDSGMLTKQTNISCVFLDSDYYFHRTGDIGYGFEDEYYNDLGLPNPQFNVTIIPKED